MATSRSLSFALPLFVAPLVGACVTTDVDKDATDDSDSDTMDETDDTDATDDTDVDTEETDETDIVAANCGNDLIASDVICFEPGSPVDGEGTVTALAVGDWSGDGKNDIILGVGASVQVSTGDDAGTQQPTVGLILSNVSGTVHDIALGKIDSNDFLDIVVASDASAAINTVFSNGEGGVSTEEAQYGGEGSTVDIHLGNVAYSGATDDILFSGECGGVLTTTGNTGEGMIQSSASFCSPTVVGLLQLGTNLTRVVGVNTATLSSWPVDAGEGLYVGEGQGTSMQGNGLALAVADLNADGVDDVAVVVSTDEVNVFFGSGEGDWSYQGEAAYKPYDVGAGATDIAAGDFDGDGDIDLAVTNATDDSITILVNGGAGTFTASELALPADASPSRIAAGELNGDDVTDIVVATASPSQVTVLLSNP